MGKYMKKAKSSGGEVALMDSYLGVRTRAKTLALQNSDSYLQLRSRRLEKQTLISDSKRQKQTPKESPVSKPQNPNSVAVDEGTHVEAEEKKECNDAEDEGIEACFGENLVGLEGRERSTRESTPCNLITDPECIRTPGSTTRPTMSTEANRRLQNSMPRHIPTANEMDEFFASAEEQQRQQFIEKYNFDLVNDAPLPGRYEWSKLDS